MTYMYTVNQKLIILVYLCMLIIDRYNFKKKLKQFVLILHRYIRVFVQILSKLKVLIARNILYLTRSLAHEKAIVKKYLNAK